MEVQTMTPQLGQEAPDSKSPNTRAVSFANVSAAATAASIAATTADQDGKKRKLDHDYFRNSKYFKICCIVKELRPFFIEVSRTTNFRDSKAAHEIQIRMKTLVELTKQVGSETSSITKSYEIPVKEPLSTVVKEEIMEKQQEEEKQAPQPVENLAASVNAMENGNRNSLGESLLNNATRVSEK